MRRQHPVPQRIAHDDRVQQDACNAQRHKEIHQILPDEVDCDCTCANRPFAGIRGGLERNLKWLTLWRGRGVYVAAERHEDERQVKNKVSAAGGNAPRRPGP